MTEKQLADHAALEPANPTDAKTAKESQPTSRSRTTNTADDAGRRTSRTTAETGDQLQLKKRARRRLVGAIALALLAVIVLPMIMDQEPRPLTQDIQIRIPSQEQNSTSLIARISPNKATSTPLPADSVAGSATNINPALPDSAEPPIDVKPEAKAIATTTKESAQEPAKDAAKKEAVKEAIKDSTKPAVKEPAKEAIPVAKEAPKDTKPPKPTSEPHPKVDESARAAAVLNDQQQWIIQLGAYRDTGNIHSLQGKVKELGYPTYTEKIDTAQGARVRLRCGPFANREAAEKAQARLKKIGAGAPAGGVLSQK